MDQSNTIIILDDIIEKYNSNDPECIYLFDLLLSKNSTNPFVMFIKYLAGYLVPDDYRDVVKDIHKNSPKDDMYYPKYYSDDQLVLITIACFNNSNIKRDMKTLQTHFDHIKECCSIILYVSRDCIKMYYSKIWATLIYDIPSTYIDYWGHIKDVVSGEYLHDYRRISENTKKYIKTLKENLACIQEKYDKLLDKCINSESRWDARKRDKDIRTQTIMHKLNY